MSNCIAAELLKKGKTVLYQTAPVLLESVIDYKINKPKNISTDFYQSVLEADLLIIDDLGTEQKNEWSASRIYNIIDSRYRNSLPTIITTNININDLEDMYHKRTYDRLMEMCTPVVSDGKSIRAQKGKEKVNILKKLIG